ncbi:MAG: radical SAM protein, partial [Clostridiales bacterium]
MKNVSFYAPGAKFYENEYHKNNREKFKSISISGNNCILNCPHCGGQMLKNMINAETPQRLSDICDNLISEGCEGILLSGGCNKAASVDLMPFCDVISKISKKIKIAVHCGFATNDTLLGLKNSGVSTVFFDVIGSAQTIKSILGINADVNDYAEKLLYMKKIGLECSPHIIIGLDYGKIKGEYA